MTFEWDEQKNARNIVLHGVSFKEAARVFKDPNALLVPDPNENEERWNAIGFVGKILFVVYTEKDDDKIRIISARRATRRERDGYCKHFFRRAR